MLKSTSVLRCNIMGNPGFNKLSGKKLMFFVNLFGKLQSQFCQG